MAQERSEAIVLRGVDFSETSRIVTFLTPDRGRITCMAKGVKRPRNQLAALLDTFNRLEIIFYWKESRAVQLLTEASLIDNYPEMKKDLDSTVYGAFPLELVYKVANENEPSRDLYMAFVRGLEEMNVIRGDARTQCCWLVLRLLTVAGFAPSLDACCECGAAVSDKPGFRYDGGATCKTCRYDTALSPHDYASLLELTESPMSCPNTIISKSGFEIVRRFATRQIESDFKSARVIQQMFYQEMGKASPFK